MNSSSIDVDKLINAVKTRPALYSRSERYETGHKQKKRKLWHEVCKEVNPDFAQMSTADKCDFDREVYKRWRSLRTCFTRELALQKREKSGKKRKRYEHFEALKFMLTEYGADVFRDESIQILQLESDDEAGDMGDFEESSKSEVGNLRNIKSEVETESYSEAEIFYDTRNPVQEILRDSLENDSRRQESDSDKLFMLSLIPSFRRINPRKKLAAKIELMKVMQSFQDE